MYKWLSWWGPVQNWLGGWRCFPGPLAQDWTFPWQIWGEQFLGENPEFWNPPHHPIPVEINAKGVDACDKNIETKVELVTVDEKRVGYVALHNYRVLLLHFLLLLRVNFDLARNLTQQFRNESRKWKHSMSELPCLGNLSRMLLCRTCCLVVSRCKPFIW